MRTLAVLGVIAMLAAPAMAVVINNPGFENGTGTIGVPSGWTAYGRGTTHMTDPPSTINIPGSNNQSTYQGASDDRSPEGSRSYSGYGSASSGGIYQVVNVTGLGGMAAKLSAYLYVQDAGGSWGSVNGWHEFGVVNGSWTNPDNLSGSSYAIWKNNATNTQGTAFPGATTSAVAGGVPGNWKIVSVNFTIPTGATQLTIYEKAGSGSGLTSTWIDNVVLTPEPASLILLALGLPMLRRRR